MFAWNYDGGRVELTKLYDKAKRSQWNATTDLDWSIDVDPEKVGQELGAGGTVRFQTLQEAENSPVKHFGEKEWRQIAVSFVAGAVIAILLSLQLREMRRRKPQDIETAPRE